MVFPKFGCLIMALPFHWALRSTSWWYNLHIMYGIHSPVNLFYSGFATSALKHLLSLHVIRSNGQFSVFIQFDFSVILDTVAIYLPFSWDIFLLGFQEFSICNFCLPHCSLHLGVFLSQYYKDSRESLASTGSLDFNTIRMSGSTMHFLPGLETWDSHSLLRLQHLQSLCSVFLFTCSHRVGLQCSSCPSTGNFLVEESSPILYKEKSL